MNDDIARWRWRGARAFRQGRPAAPALDPQVMAALQGLPVGDPVGQAIMRAFGDGWMTANLAAPVPGVD